MLGEDFMRLVLSLRRTAVYSDLPEGSDVGSIASSTGQYRRLFNPRNSRWEDHFSVEGPNLAAKKDVVRVTIRMPRANDPEHAILQQIGEFPRRGRELPERRGHDRSRHQISDSNSD
jgi:hypothetical protein